MEVFGNHWLINSMLLLQLLLSHVSRLRLWPHRHQPTRLLRPWISLGKNTGVGCHFLLQCVKVKSESEVVSDSLRQTPWTVALQAAPSMGVPRQESWSGLPLTLYGMPNTAGKNSFRRYGPCFQSLWSGKGAKTHLLYWYWTIFAR